LKYMGGNCWKKIFKEIEQMRLDIWNSYVNNATQK
jgi:hypothetical protein